MQVQVQVQHLGEDQFDGGLEGLGHGDHDIGAEYPEDVVEEEAAEQDAAGHHVVEVQQLHAVDGEGHPEQVVGQPVLLHDVPDADHRAEGQHHLRFVTSHSGIFAGNWCSLCALGDQGQEAQLQVSATVRKVGNV